MITKQSIESPCTFQRHDDKAQTRQDHSSLQIAFIQIVGNELRVEARKTAVRIWGLLPSSSSSGSSKRSCSRTRADISGRTALDTEVCPSGVKTLAYTRYAGKDRSPCYGLFSFKRSQKASEGWRLRDEWKSKQGRGTEWNKLTTWFGLAEGSPPACALRGYGRTVTA